MPIRLVLLSAAHVHAPSYAACAAAHPDAVLAGVWDDDFARGSEFSKQWSVPFFGSLEDALGSADAVVIASENTKHRDLALAAAKAGKHVLCEKPLATTVEDAEAMIQAAKEAGVNLMTAFPCPFSPAFHRLVSRLESGELGSIVSICATNQGSCPMGWFVDPAASGGGAIMDHTVHVADLFHRLLKAAPRQVHATASHNLRGLEVEDCGMLTLRYDSGVFCSLDSSWSVHSSFKTWGNVTMKVVCEKGLVEVDLFQQSLDYFHTGSKSHTVSGFGSNLDQLMVNEFLASITEKRPPKVTGEDGLAALKVALAAYDSVKKGEPCPLT